MKLHLLLSFALLTVCSCKKQDPISTGFAGAKFGMLRDELKAAFPKATDHGKYFALTDTEYVGVPARVGFVFEDSNALQYIFVEFDKKHGGFDQYNEVKKRLTSQFGKPFREDSNMAALRTVWGGYEGGSAAILEQSGPLGDGSFSLVLGPSEIIEKQMKRANAQ